VDSNSSTTLPHPSKPLTTVLITQQCAVRDETVLFNGVN
jgi:hypothetical protein